MVWNGWVVSGNIILLNLVVASWLYVLRYFSTFVVKKHTLSCMHGIEIGFIHQYIVTMISSCIIIYWRISNPYSGYTPTWQEPIIRRNVTSRFLHISTIWYFVGNKRHSASYWEEWRTDYVGSILRRFDVSLRLRFFVPLASGARGGPHIKGVRSVALY